MPVTVYSKEQDKEFLDKVTSEYLSVDVIGEKLGGKVLSFSDEWFAAAENLLKPTAPIRDATRFVHSGAWYDGWETRRHNEDPYDWVVFKMGVASAYIIGCEVDTAFFNGNHAPYVSVDALYEEDASAQIGEDDPRWTEVIEKLECGPSQRHFFLRDSLTSEKYTHVKLKMYPDGGIARFRLYGKVVPLPFSAQSKDSIDLANVCNGAVALRVSDQHFGSADNLLLPGRGHDMSDGWETTRSRTPGHVDWAVIQLGRLATYAEKIVVDTAHFRGNFPQYITVHGVNCERGSPVDDSQWVELVPKSKTGPDKEHEYLINKDVKITHIKLTIIPDGGVKRVRFWGR